ncbi:MAG: substrate-binding domain-containing protein [Rhodothermaceae bacterium]
MIRFKLIKYILAAMLLLTSCSNNNTSAKYVIGFSQCNSAEPWRETMNKELTEEAKKHKDIDLLIVDAQQNNSKQVADVENFIAQEVDLIIISPNESRPLTAVVERAYNAGIPVVVLDRNISSDSYTSFIGANNHIIGKAAGAHAAKLLNYKGTIVEIWGLKGSTPAIDRHNGFVEEISKHKDIKIVYEQDGAWLRRRGMEIMENALQKLEKIDLVYAHNDPMAIGAYLAAKNAQREKESYFLGIDGLKGPEGGIKAVSEGTLSATFLYPTGSKQAIETAVKILKGEKVSKNITLETETILPENAKNY